MFMVTPTPLFIVFLLWVADTYNETQDQEIPHYKHEVTVTKQRKDSFTMFDVNPQEIELLSYANIVFVLVKKDACWSLEWMKARFPRQNIRTYANNANCLVLKVGASYCHDNLALNFKIDLQVSSQVHFVMGIKLRNT